MIRRRSDVEARSAIACTKPARLTAMLAAMAALAACSGDEPRDVRAISTSEAEALDEAAAMIEQRRLPPEVFAVDEGAPAPDAPPDSPPDDPEEDRTQ